MGWLASGGTNFSYRMSIPVALSPTSANKQIVTPFPAWFLKSQGKIVQSLYQDVHCTKADGTTELPCSLNVDKNEICIDYASLPQGRTTIYVYYGHASVSASPAALFETGTLVDSGFDSGTSGNTLSGTWADGSPINATALASKIYNHSHPNTEMLSPMEAKLVGPTTEDYGGVSETVTSALNTDGGELRFWLYFDSTDQDRRIFAKTSGATWDGSPYYIHFNSAGQINVFTTIAGNPNGYTSGDETNISTYSLGWWQFKLAFNFTTKRYTFFRRQKLTDAWTQLGLTNKNIPFMCANSPTALLGTVWEAYQNVNLWVDDLKYSNSAITQADTTAVEVIAANDERDSEADTSSRYYLWGNDIDATHIQSNATSTYYGAETSNKAGISAAGVKYHYLLKYLEGVLPIGTVNEAKLHLYAQSNTDIDEATTLKCHKFLNTGANTDMTTYVRTGWANQTTNLFPTWNSRFGNPTTYAGGPGAVSWLTAGATNSSEIDTSDANAPTLSLSPSFSLGYKTFTLPNAWLTDWLGDTYSQGVLIKDSTDTAGASDRFTTFTASSQVNSPVLEVDFSALDSDQLTNKKISTDTYTYYATFPTQNRYIQIPSSSEFAVMGWVNADSRLDFAYISPEGRFHRIAKDVYIGQASATNFPFTGLYYDPDEKRFWVQGTDGDKHMIVGYSDQYVPLNWTWVDSGFAVDRADMMPKNGVVHCIYANGSNDPMKYRTYTRATNTWSSITTLANIAPGGTRRNILTAHDIGSGDAMTGSGEIWLDGSLEYYPTWDIVIIGTEAFWYTGKDAVNNKLTGVTRAACATSAAAHAAGANVTIGRYFYGYMTVTHNSYKACIDVTYTIVATPIACQPYVKVCFIRHYYADAAGTWKDETGNTLTLPLDQRTERVISTSGMLAYGTGGIALNNGDFLCAVSEKHEITSGAGDHTHIMRLANTGTSFTDIDISLDLKEASFVGATGGKCFVTGLDATFLKLQTLKSEDYGSTWGDMKILSEHTLTDHLLWSSSVSEKADVNDMGYAYATHYAWFGAIYLNAVKVRDTAINNIMGVPFDDISKITGTDKSNIGKVDDVI